ncbi:MAG: hypothetical protein ACYDCC_02435 [Actinomycetota bacterium]
MRLRGAIVCILLALVAGTPQASEAQILPANGCGGFAGGAQAACGFTLGGAHLSIAGLMTIDPTQFPIQKEVSIQIALFHYTGTAYEQLMLCSADGNLVVACGDYMNDPILQFGDRMLCVVKGQQVGYFRCESALPSP